MSRLAAPLWLVMLLTLPAGAQQPYRRFVVPGKYLCFAWTTREYVYHLDAAGSARIPGDSEVAAIEASFDTWRTLAASCSDFLFTRGADVQRPRVGYVKATDQEPNPINENIITFREAACADVVPVDDKCYDDDTCADTYRCWDHGGAIIALTVSAYSTRTGHLLDADIELNGADFFFTTVSSPPCEGAPSSSCVATDLQNTVTHELGHVAGLDHVTTVGSTMEATAPPGETQKRVIDFGSAEGFCSIYPRGLPPTQCLEPEQKEMALKAEAHGTGCSAAPPALLPMALLAAWRLIRRRGRKAGRPS